MPFGTGPAGWHAWPYMAYWMRCWHPWYTAPYWSPFQPLIEDQLSQIKKRLGELKKQGKEKK